MHMIFTLLAIVMLGYGILPLLAMWDSNPVVKHILITIGALVLLMLTGHSVLDDKKEDRKLK